MFRKALSEEAMSLDEDQLVPLYFLERHEMWDTIKPYNFHYVPKADIPMHNLLRSPTTTRVRNMRSVASTSRLDLQGFEVHRLPTSMTYDKYKDERLVEEIYIPELERHFKDHLGAKHVKALDFQLRLRDPDFPYFDHKPRIGPQPSLMTHVDVTPDAAKSIIRELYEDVTDQICASRYQVITAWRPLSVPVRDWPLAVCDASSVDPVDLVDTDVIYPNYLAENRMLHYNENQRWYWLPDQDQDEILVFKAVDSDPEQNLPCPHGAFPLPGSGTSDQRLRESIDVRLLIMYANIDYPPSIPWSSSEPIVVAQ